MNVKKVFKKILVIKKKMYLNIFPHLLIIILRRKSGFRLFLTASDINIVLLNQTKSLITYSCHSFYLIATFPQEEIFKTI